MESDLTELGESALLASRILSGITRALQDNHSTMLHLFKAVNRGTQGVLELDEFIEGLIRLHILDASDVVTVKQLTEAMYLMDPTFDGKVNYPALNRAVQAAQNIQRKQAKENIGIEGQRDNAHVSVYGDELPFEIVKVDKNSKSVYDFNRTRDMFRQQQAELLAQHGERVDCF
jgi:hypothetical protein